MKSWQSQCNCGRVKSKVAVVCLRCERILRKKGLTVIPAPKKALRYHDDSDDPDSRYS